MNKIWVRDIDGMIITEGKPEGMGEKPGLSKLFSIFITQTLLYEVYKWKMWPNNGVHTTF